MNRYLERTRPGVAGKLVHVENPTAGGMLCGLAVVASASQPIVPELTPVDRGKVNCRGCLRVIRLCKRVSTGKMTNGMGE